MDCLGFFVPLISKEQRDFKSLHLIRSENPTGWIVREGRIRIFGHRSGWIRLLRLVRHGAVRFLEKHSTH